MTPDEIRQRVLAAVNGDRHTGTGFCEAAGTVVVVARVDTPHEAPHLSPLRVTGAGLGEPRVNAVSTSLFVGSVDDC